MPRKQRNEAPQVPQYVKVAQAALAAAVSAALGAKDLNASAMEKCREAVGALAPHAEGEKGADKKAWITAKAAELVGDEVKYATIRAYVSQWSGLAIALDAKKEVTYVKPEKQVTGKGKSKKTVTVNKPTKATSLADIKTSRELNLASQEANVLLGIKSRGKDGGKESPVQQVVPSVAEQIGAMLATPTGQSDLRGILNRFGFDLAPLARVAPAADMGRAEPAAAGKAAPKPRRTRQRPTVTATAH